MCHISLQKGTNKREIFRHELKYRIPWGEKEKLTARLQPLLQPDPNARDGIYQIRSLYFDDYWDSAYLQKEAGVLERKKYRIRIYNYDDGIIKLERKKKYDAYILKESADLTRQELEKILAGDYVFLLCSDKKLLREFYVECTAGLLRPRTIVDYEREPWILEAGTVRITFDMNIRAAVGGFDLFDENLPCLPVMEPDSLVLEVKYTQFLPKFVREILPLDCSEFTAVSKYVLCREKTQYLWGETYWFPEGSLAGGNFCHEIPERKGEVLL